MDRVGFNREAASTKTRAEFIRRFKPIYPHLDLSAEWNKMFPKKAKATNKNKAPE